MDFQTQLHNIIAEDYPLSAKALTFLSDLARADRTALGLIWPGVAVARRRKIAATLAQLAEDNVEYNFNAVFLTLLDDPDAAVRQTAVGGLVEDESLPALRRLIAVLAGDPAAAVRAAAAQVLGSAALRAEIGKIKGDWPARLAYVVQWSDQVGADPEVRRRALESLGYFSGSPDLPAEIERAYNGGGPLRASALAAMGRSMDPRWTPRLTAAVRGPDPLLRFEAAQALGELGEPANVPALVPLLGDADSEVQLAAAWALGQLGGRVAFQALQLHRETESPALRAAIEDALTEIRLAADPLLP